MPAAASTLATELVAWQRAHGRHGLPWQGRADPYRVWLSEIMLQQTQVSTVLAYYDRFLQRFPDVATLAAAPLDEVLALWAGLGYYSRARHLHRCAQAVVELHGGRFPSSAEGLQTLPGIGRSTAAAIASFCFGERVSILDGNVKRVLSRALLFEGDLAEPRQERLLWDLAQALVPEQAADMSAYTQGLMDLGATVCRLRQPRCDACPLAGRCRARAEGRQAELPHKTRRLVRRSVELPLLWLRREDAHFLVQRPGRGIWAGLWALPDYPSADALRAALAPWPGRLQPGETFTHVLTHRDLVITPFTLRCEAGGPPADWLATHWPAGRWVRQAELPGHGLPAPLQRLLQAG